MADNEERVAQTEPNEDEAELDQEEYEDDASESSSFMEEMLASSLDTYEANGLIRLVCFY